VVVEFVERPLPKPSDAAYVEASGGFEEAGVGVFGKGPHLQRHVLVEDATGSHPRLKLEKLRA
jgi:hypothetical protein